MHSELPGQARIPQIPRRNSMYHIVFQRDGFEVGTLYWNGLFNETLSLARTIAFSCKADVFRIVEVAEGSEVCSEQAPFGLVGTG